VLAGMPARRGRAHPARRDDDDLRQILLAAAGHPAMAGCSPAGGAAAPPRATGPAARGEYRTEDGTPTLDEGPADRLGSTHAMVQETTHPE